MDVKTQNDEHGDDNLSSIVERLLLQNDRFIHFCQRNAIDPQCYRMASQIPRFVRINLRKLGSDILKVDLDRYESNARPVQWLPAKFGFYSLPQHVPLRTIPAYKDGLLLGMDAASAVAVMALDPQPGDRILDMCCAPGAKMCFIADYMHVQYPSDDTCSAASPPFELTGVDISLRRLELCKKLLKKYNVENARLVLADGTIFGTGRGANYSQPLWFNPHLLKRRLKQWDIKSRKKMEQQQQQQQQEEEEEEETGLESNAGAEVPQLPDYVTESGMVLYESGVFRKRRIEWQKTSRVSGKDESDADKGSHSQRNRNHIDSSNGLELYDKIIVDAECTTDGSMRHLLQLAASNWDEFERHILDEERMQSVVNLQKRLLRNGFRLLRPGGVLVYSTCSLSQAQNEQVVQWLLNVCSDARLLPALAALSPVPPHSTGTLANTVRFDPASSGTSGLFIAKLTKVPNAGQQIPIK